MKFRNGFKIGLVLAVFVLMCSSASWADWNEIFFDDFDDGDYDGWTVTNWKGETRQAPDVVSSPEGYSLRGVGSGYGTPPPVDAWISHKVSISDVTELKIEMRAKSGPQWPNQAAVYLTSSSDYYAVDDYGEAGENETADLQRYVNGSHVWLHRYPIGSRAFEWHTFAWTRDANGWWSLSIDGQVEAANFCQDNQLTSFDRVGIMLMRNQSEIEWVRISFATEPPEPPEPPVASFTYLPEEAMVGGNIAFDASSSHDSDGTIVRYEWDFDNGPSETRQEPQIEHLFELPKTYIVTLTVTDDDGLTDSTSEEVELSLKNGDLLLWRSEGSPVPGFWTHVGMYYEASNKVIEARRGYPVMRHPLSDWFFDEKTCVRALEVRTPQATRDAAVNFAMDRLGLGYDLPSALSDLKQDGTNLSDLDQRWYCSELVWAAYLSASNGQINLDPDQGVVTPSEIDDSMHVKFLGEHIEDIPGSVWFPWFYGTALSPVDLIITDPDGLILNKQGSQIPGAIYQEVDTNADNNLDDFFAIPEPKVGVYLIHVIAEPGASPTETFTIVVNKDGTPRVLAQDIQVQDIPDFPFVVTTLDSLSADMEIDPETLNLSSKGNWITCYIQFPEAYYIANIDSSTILLNGEIHPARLFAGDEEDIEQILMIKFARSELQKMLEPGNVELIVTGELFDGTSFECRNTIRVIDKGKGKKQVGYANMGWWAFACVGFIFYQGQSPVFGDRKQVAVPSYSSYLSYLGTPYLFPERRCAVHTLPD